MKSSLRSPKTDVSLVAPNLFVGSRPPPGRYRWLGVIVLCAQEYQPPSFAFPGVAVLHVPIDDDPRRPMFDHEIMLVTSNARTVARYLHTGQRVLVTCALGLNRSALVAGLAMQRAFAMSSEDVVGQIRAARSSHALSNPNFVQLLQRNDA